MTQGTDGIAKEEAVHGRRDTSLDAYASCRLTREEKALAQAAAARASKEVFSDWVREAVREKVERELGPGVCGSTPTGGSPNRG